MGTGFFRRPPIFTQASTPFNISMWMSPHCSATRRRSPWMSSPWGYPRHSTALNGVDDPRDMYRLIHRLLRHLTFLCEVIPMWMSPNSTVTWRRSPWMSSSWGYPRHSTSLNGVDDQKCNTFMYVLGSRMGPVPWIVTWV